jgi:hypothetical protein
MDIVSTIDLCVRYDNCIVSCCAAAQYMGHKQHIVSEIVILLHALRSEIPLGRRNSAYKMSPPEPEWSGRHSETNLFRGNK